MSPSTPERLRAAAEDLLLEQGEGATTLRDITDRAGANVAAVGYHFGSKTALVALVYGQALREVSERQRQRLDELAADAPLEDVVRVWFAPALDAVPDPRETRLWALIQRGALERSPTLRDAMRSVKDLVDSHLMNRLAAALPHLDATELTFRHDAVLAALGAWASGAPELPSAGAADSSSGAPGHPEGTADLLIAWVVGSLRAPAARSRPPGPQLPTDR